MIETDKIKLEEEFNAAVLQLKRSNRVNYLKFGAALILTGLALYVLISAVLLVSNIMITVSQ